MNPQAIMFLIAVISLTDCAPLTSDSSSPLSVLFVNDFTLNFVEDDVALNFIDDVVQKTAQKSTKCPASVYPEAAQQFDYTTAVVEAIDSSIELTLQYDFYRGGKGNFLNGFRFTRDDFAHDAGVLFRDFCLEGPEQSDLPTYVHNELQHAQDVDVLVLFTAAPASELAAALPIDADMFKAVVVVGLNGADAAAFYPDTSISISDFASPETVACMINSAYSDIQQARAEPGYDVRQGLINGCNGSRRVSTGQLRSRNEEFIPSSRFIFHWI
ncbi:hypothetical protein PMAYCL1PPCAC_04168 [Pristionchus mayeri]|uniref:VWFA domain-containing protein n=1 Tax=Pristionchus mayeri TaxID=1317129 RepID=A0AAN4Z8J7_9BILA|nr:hypothetical protein PMAYCL1PPCAC_04168 [Pristionchus mayeri]